MQKASVLIVAKGVDHKGILANCAFVLGLSVGKLLPAETFGVEVVDGDGTRHPALTNISHYVRESGQSKMRTLRAEFIQNPDVSVVDYTEDAAPADYAMYTKSLGAHKGEEIIYRAIHIYGPAEYVISKTKNLSMLQ
ncbi:DUF2000 family protein [Patescibacteria group bacterium]|nr:MAG: DUF2000 family protein [Patescibacteria group bacterium]